METVRLHIGPAPSDEDCVQVSDLDYSDQSRKECRAYRNQLRRFLLLNGFETWPDSFNLTIKGSRHDYGTYYEVCAEFDPNDETSWKMFELMDEDGPKIWDEEAKNELSNSSLKV